jgi:hypothetical protein
MASPRREVSTLASGYKGAPMWPGIAWGHDARCLCSWAPLGGVMQVKRRHGNCPVHWRTT